MARLVKDFLSSYLTFVENTESATNFHVWAAISIMAGALERKCYMKWGHETIYPNMFVVLVGPSGQSRKGVAVGIANSMLDTLSEFNKGSNKTTPEKLINVLKNSMKQFEDRKAGIVKKQSPLTIVSGELTTLLGEGNVKFLGILTDLYDSHDTWVYETKHAETELIEGVCLNVLGATAPDWLPSMLPSEAVGGGFTSRCIFACEMEKGKIVANPNEIAVDEELKIQLEATLLHIKNNIVGEYQFDDEALAIYMDFYIRQEEGIKQGSWPVIDPKFRGYVARRATHLKKLCMILTASRTDKMIVTKKDIERAINILELTEKKMERAFRGVGTGRFLSVTEAVITFLENAPNNKARRSAIMHATWRENDAWTMDQVELSLRRANMISVTDIVNQNDKVYTLIAKKDGGTSPPPSEEDTEPTKGLGV